MSCPVCGTTKTKTIDGVFRYACGYGTGYWWKYPCSEFPVERSEANVLTHNLLMVKSKNRVNEKNISGS